MHLYIMIIYIYIYIYLFLFVCVYIYFQHVSCLRVESCAYVCAQIFWGTCKEFSRITMTGEKVETLEQFLRNSLAIL